MHGGEGLVILLAITALVVIVIFPVWTVILLFRVRNAQETHADRLLELERRLGRELRELKGSLTGQASTTGQVATPATPSAAQPMPTGTMPAPVIAAAPAVPTAVSSPAVAPVHPVAPAMPASDKLPPLVQSPAASRPAVASPPPPPAEPVPMNAFEATARLVLGKIWNWIVVGEEYRTPGASWEYAVATHWLLRCSILALLFGIGFFLKYSIDHGILGPEGRVALSILVGVGMMGAGLRLLHRQFHLLAQGLLGAGIVTLYFSVFAASALYHLIPDVYASFALMALITLVAGVIAVRCDSLLVAVLGILGGYGTPVMLSTGTKNFPGLFGYMLLIGIGVLGMARQRRWHLLNYLGMACTYILYFAAVDKFYSTADFWNVMPFLIAFFVLYSTVIFIYNLTSREKSTLIELLGLLANAGIFFGAAYYLVDDCYGQIWTSLVALGLSVFYTLHVYYFLARRIQDRGLLLSFIGLASLFLALTIPLLLSGEWITVTWALQALVMLWMAGKLDSQFLRHLAYLLYLIVLGRLAFVDLNHQFGYRATQAGTLPFQEYLLEFGRRLVMFGVPIASLAGAWKLSATRQPPAADLAVGNGNDIRGWFRSSGMARAFVATSVGFLFLYLNFELKRSCGCLYPPLGEPVLTLLWVALAGYLLYEYFRQRSAALLVVFLVACLAVLYKLLFFDLNCWEPHLERLLYTGTYSGTAALMRLLDFGFVLGFLALVFVRFRPGPDTRQVSVYAGIAGLALLFLYLTLELNSCLACFVPGLRAGGVSILWALFALGLILGGIRTTTRPARLSGLVLFAVVVGKVFFSDLANLDQLYRVVAFLILGILLFAGSFMYLKYQSRFGAKPNA